MPDNYESYFTFAKLISAIRHTLSFIVSFVAISIAISMTILLAIIEGFVSNYSPMSPAAIGHAAAPWTFGIAASLITMGVSGIINNTSKWAWRTVNVTSIFIAISIVSSIPSILEKLDKDKSAQINSMLEKAFAQQSINDSVGAIILYEDALKINDEKVHPDPLSRAMIMAMAASAYAADGRRTKYGEMIGKADAVAVDLEWKDKMAAMGLYAAIAGAAIQQNDVVVEERALAGMIRNYDGTDVRREKEVLEAASVLMKRYELTGRHDEANALRMRFPDADQSHSR